MSIHGKQIADASIAGSKLQNSTVPQEKLSLTSPVASTDAATKQYVDDGVAGAAYDQQVYVAAGADPLVATGSVLKPFATVTAAMASIADATPTKRYGIMVAAGAYTEPGAVNLKANVFVVGLAKNAVRITASSWGLDANFTGGNDNRSGMSNVILAGAGTYGFNWTTVTSTAGKLYFDSVSFSAALTLTGYNNAIAQAQFSNCQMFGAFAVQGVNVGVFNDNILFSNLTLTQSPYGGVPTILNAVGGYCSGTVTATTTVTDFNRRISIFARSFWMNAVTVDGASVYLDYTVDSLPSAGATVLNGANLVSIDLGTGANKSLSNLNFPTEVNNPIMPASSSATNLGDWGKQWMFSFNYVNVSTGTDIYIGTVDSVYDGAGSTSGYSVYLQPDQYGVQSNVNGGFLDMRTANTTGTGISGKVEIATGTSANGNSGDINLTTGTPSGTGTRGVVNITSGIVDLKLVDELRLNGLSGNAGQVLTSNGSGLAPTWEDAGGASGSVYVKDTVRVATNAALPANNRSGNVITATSGGSINDVGIDGITDLAVADRVLVKDEVLGANNGIYEITDIGTAASGPSTPVVPSAPTFSGALITCGTGGTHATLTDAVAAAAPGDRIQVLAGTITETATVTVNKSLEIFGTGATCIVQRSSTTAVITVTAANVYIHDFAVTNGLQASTDGGGQSSCINAATMSRSAYGGASSIRIENMTFSMPKVGVFVSGTNWVVKGCSFAPNALSQTAATTLRCVFTYGSEGQSFVDGNTFTTTLDNARMTGIYINTVNDGIAPNWESGYKGDVVIKSNSFIDAGGAPRSYIDATSMLHQSGPAATEAPNGQCSLYIVNNNFSLDHQSSPVVFFGRAGASAPRPLSFFNYLVVSDNSFGAREASTSQKGALFFTSGVGLSSTSLGTLVGGLYGANNTIASQTLPATNFSVMADSSLLMVRDSTFYADPSPLLTLAAADPGSPFVLTRTADADTSAEVLRGIFMAVNEGDVGTGKSFICTTPNPITLNTTALTFIEDAPGRDAHVVVNSTYTGSGEVLVGSIYIEKNNLSLNNQSKAFMGVTVDAPGGVTAQAKVEIRQGATVYADFTTTSTTMTSVNCNGIIHLPTGWYSIYLMCNEVGSTVALQGLYLKV